VNEVTCECPGIYTDVPGLLVRPVQAHGHTILTAINCPVSVLTSRPVRNGHFLQNGPAYNIG